MTYFLFYVDHDCKRLFCTPFLPYCHNDRYRSMVSFNFKWIGIPLPVEPVDPHNWLSLFLWYWVWLVTSLVQGQLSQGHYSPFLKIQANLICFSMWSDRKSGWVMNSAVRTREVKMWPRRLLAVSCDSISNCTTKIDMRSTLVSATYFLSTYFFPGI